jgi:hypothetical protein
MEKLCLGIAESGLMYMDIGTSEHSYVCSMERESIRTLNYYSDCTPLLLAGELGLC